MTCQSKSFPRNDFLCAIKLAINHLFRSSGLRRTFHLFAGKLITINIIPSNFIFASEWVLDCLGGYIFK